MQVAHKGLEQAVGTQGWHLLTSSVSRASIRVREKLRRREAR